MGNRCTTSMSLLDWIPLFFVLHFIAAMLVFCVVSLHRIEDSVEARRITCGCEVTP